MAEIVLCCGQVSSGKSTFARRLAAERGHFPFSADEWMRHFYGEPPERDVFDRQLGQCCEMIYRMAERLLARGVDVVLDFGFWQRAERIAVRQRFGRADIGAEWSISRSKRIVSGLTCRRGRLIRPLITTRSLLRPWPC
ncbi:MAG: AAA family ATPase [Uliginosibacterium sp.]|nr:AAA family ATPase [Uliginosibacterium sp.]